MKEKELKFKFDLNCKWAIYVPSTMNVNEHIDNTKEVERVIGELSDLFGGATATPALGGWRCADGKVVTEQVTIVYAYCTTEQSVEHADRVVDIARRIAREYKQECVTVEYNNQVAFVGAE